MRSEHFEVTMDDGPGTPKGPATGQPTDCVEVPFDEIDLPDGKVMKGDAIVDADPAPAPAKKAVRKSAKKAAKKKAKGKNKGPLPHEIHGPILYARFANGMTWKEIEKESRIKAPWILVSRYARENGLEYPPKPMPIPSDEEATGELEEDMEIDPAVVAEPEPEPEPEPELEPEPVRVEPEYEILDLAKRADIVKSVPGQKYELRFKRGTSVVRVALTDIPPERRILRIIADARKVSR